jgi:EAL domain-containing protein (putative c-di-GMP-specific phosphodiesterase class I)
VSIDDFGTGHSLLARLSELPFVELKLDRSFVNGCATDESKRWTCQTVVELAHRFDLTAVAEGVETLEDIEYLTDIGCDAGQGYYFARPMKSTDFATMLMSHGRPKAHWTHD